MQRYFIDNVFFDLDSKIKITGNDYHHMKNVMRYKLNDNIIVCTDDKQYLCKIDLITDYILLSIEKDITVNNELYTYICIAQGLIRKDKQSEVIRRLVELGCCCYLNVTMERSVVKASDSDSIYTRNLKIIKEASEQARRSKLMELENTKSFNQFLEYSKKFDLKFVCYENEKKHISNYLENIENIKNKKILILIGPEGGISEKEILVLKEAQFLNLSLGKRILRTETAPLFVMSVLGYLLDSDYE